MPLRFLLAAIGSSGDVNPVIGLGAALRARGHEVELATNEIFRPQVEAAGLTLLPLGTAAEAEAVMADPRLWHPVRGFACIAERALLPNLEPLYRLIADRRDRGIRVAATTLCLGARAAQERLGIPTASLHLQPMVFRSLVDNSRLGPFDPGPGMPVALKRALFWVADRAFIDRLAKPGYNAFRARVGLPPVKELFAWHHHSPELVLGLFPDWFAPAQPDWPPQTHLTGFILEDAGGRPEAHQEAEAFLAAGPPPVLVTPGSAATDRTKFFANTVKAVSRLGLRAMLVTNHPGQLPSRLPPGVQAFPYLAFSAVMPRCAAVIYHGGIGTLAQATRAGVPQLVVPNAHDQPDNGQRIERLGLGHSLRPGRYSARAATRLIGDLVSSAAIRQRCREMAPRVDRAAALEAACALLERLG
jgi:rhamnosyltransferase subunit B